MHEYWFVFSTSRNICYGYLWESPHWGDSYKYPKHMLYEEIRIKQCLSGMSFCSSRILDNCKFILIETSLGNKCCRCKKGLLYLDSLEINRHCFTRETNFVTSCLLTCTTSAIWKGFYSIKKEFAFRSKFLPSRAVPFAEGKQKRFWHLAPWK